MHTQKKTPVSLRKKLQRRLLNLTQIYSSTHIYYIQTPFKNQSLTKFTKIRENLSHIRPALKYLPNAKFTIDRNFEICVTYYLNPTRDFLVKFVTAKYSPKTQQLVATSVTITTRKTDPVLDFLKLKKKKKKRDINNIIYLFFFFFFKNSRTLAPEFPEL